jgi:phage-related protein
MADVKDAGSGVASTAAKTSGRMADKGGELATGFISAVGSVLEDTVHAVGNVGVTTVMEATRVLTTTAVGIRQAIGSAISGTAPDFADQQRKEHEYRQSH